LPTTPEDPSSKVQVLLDSLKTVGENKINSRGNISEFFNLHVQKNNA